MEMNEPANLSVSDPHVPPHGAIANKPPISLQNTGGAASQPP
jgi:hypothetical protein